MVSIKDALITIIVLVLVLGVLKYLFNFGFKTIWKLAVNGIIGLVALYLLNLLPFFNFTINIWTCLIAGIFGIPGIILLILLPYLGIYL